MTYQNSLKPDTSRREFVRRALFVTGALSLSPRLLFSSDPFKEILITGEPTPFRKEPRKVKEVVPGFIWMDAADFTHYGGWLLDTQHTHLMGSSYLMAGGVDKPVEDADGKFYAESAGPYRLWVRSRDWHADVSPGRFALSINGQEVPYTFGAKNDQWTWEDAGSVTLKKGKNHILLKDKTGHFGRCSSILLTKTPDFRPADELERFRKEKARFCGYSYDVKDKEHYDFVVAGGGCAGVCAAITAAEMGLKALLITDRPVLGGNLSTEIGIHPVGAASKHPDKNARETGLFEHILQGLVNEGDIHPSDAFRDYCDKTAHLTVLLNEHVEEVKMEGNTIKGIQSSHTLEGHRSYYSGNMFLDATGDAWLGYHAGAEYRIGREARSEFNEPWAPIKPDKITMSGTLRQNGVGYFVQEEPQPVNYEPMEHTHIFPHKEMFKRRITDDYLKTGFWWMEHPGTWDDLYQPEESRDELIRLTLGFWDYLKNYWPQKRQVANMRLTGISANLGKRETRRLVGDYIVTGNDCMEGKEFEDTVAYTGWSLDVHHPLGLLSPTKPFDINPKIPITGIPYRSLYSKNIKNLFMAGRNTSCTHYALGTLRVQRTTALMGEAVAVAAALCKKEKLSPRELGQHKMKELQKMLNRRDLYLPKTIVNDPENLAQKATVAASSTKEGTKPANILSGTTRNLDGGIHYWASDPNKPFPQYLELDFEAPIRFNQIHLAFDTNLDPKFPQPMPKECVKKYKVLAFADGKWKKIAEEKKNALRKRVFTIGDTEASKVRIQIDETNGLNEARIFEVRLYS